MPHFFEQRESMKSLVIAFFSKDLEIRARETAFKGVVLQKVGAQPAHVYFKFAAILANHCTGPGCELSQF